MGKKNGGKSTKGKAAKAGKTTRRPADEPAFDAPVVGLLLAAVIAGPRLYSLYQDGNLDVETALLHGGLVAVGCSLGVSMVNHLIADYRAQADRERRIQEMMDALEDVVHEGLPIQGVVHPGAGHPGHPGRPGHPGHPGPGHPVPGQRTHGHAGTGHAGPGQPAAGHPAAGQPAAGQPDAGQPSPALPASPQAGAGQPGPDNRGPGPR